MARDTRFLTAEWRYLAMVNYDIDPAILTPYVPHGTELDSWNGRTFLSVVGLLFQPTRIFGLPLPFRRSFEDVNLRFYLRREVGSEWRRGVAFIKEIVPSAAVAAVARAVYNENFVAMPMRHAISQDWACARSGGSIEYAWLYQAEWNRLGIQASGAPRSLTPGSQEEFIADRYWGYSRQPDGGSVEFRVAHPSWRIQQGSEACLACDVAQLYGQAFSEYLTGRPSSAFLADGSQVVVYKGRKISMSTGRS